MNRISLKDLPEAQNLNHSAMAAVRGGMFGGLLYAMGTAEATRTTTSDPGISEIVVTKRVDKSSPGL